MSDQVRLVRRNGHTGPVARRRDLAADGASEIAAQHELLQALPVGIYTTDAAGHITFYNEAAAALWGCRPTLNSDQWCGSWRMYWPDGTPLPHDQCPMATALKEQRTLSGNGQEAVAERPDGTRIPFMAFPSLLRDPAGNVLGAVNMFVDISERKRAEEDARRAEQEFRDFVENANVGMHWVGADGIILWANRTEMDMLGFTPDEYIGRPIAEFHVDQPLIEDILQRLANGESINNYEARMRCKDDSTRHVLINSNVLWDADKFVRTRCFTRDITERKQNEARIAILAQEAEHRAKNVLATVQAIVHLTNADTPEGLKRAIAGRIQALANVHALFVGSSWTGAELRNLIAQELLPYAQDGEERVRIDGTNDFLEPNSAQTIAMCLHELATNAAKYGALAVSHGHVNIESSRKADGRLVLRWAETDGPLVRPPKHQGAGTRMMEGIIRGSPMGEICFDWHRDGLVCEITLPASK